MAYEPNSQRPRANRRHGVGPLISARQFWKGTRDHDVRQNIAALLQSIEAAPPFEILEFGRVP
jgi:hypothetical protein